MKRMFLCKKKWGGYIFKFVFVALIFLITNCAERKFTLQTKPENVLCEVNGRQLGVSPVVVKYIENGTFRIHLSKDGYENYDGQLKLKTKWFNIIGLDFIGEVMPFRVVDAQHIEISMTPITKIRHETFKKKVDEMQKKTD